MTVHDSISPAPLDVTVAICTHNRCDSLRRTLETAAALQIPQGMTWELLVIDNNSRDATQATVESFVDRLPLVYRRESAQGLSHARNRAVAESRGELLIFTDDDVLLDRSWLNAMWSAAQAFPRCGYFGGRVVPYWPAGVPGWFRQETLKALGGLIVSHDLGCDDRPYAAGETLPIGAAMAFRREWLERVGSFRVDLGTSGAKRGAGEDSDMIARAQAHGAEGAYVGTAVCEHCVEPHRTTLRHAFEYGVQRGLAQVAMEGEAAPSGRLSAAALYAARGVLQTIKWRGDRTRLCLRNAGMEIGRRRARRTARAAT